MSSFKDFTGKDLRVGQLCAFPYKSGSSVSVGHRVVSKITDKGVFTVIPHEFRRSWNTGRPTLVVYPSHLIIIAETYDGDL